MKLQILTTLSIIACAAIGAAEDASVKKEIPLEISIGLSGGYSSSRVEADSLMEVYFEPTSGVRPIAAPVFGLHAQVTFREFLGVSAGFQYERKGQRTARAQVLFADDIFVHDFESSTVLEYVAVPVIVKGGYMHNMFWAFAGVGVVPAVLMRESLVWKIDDREVAPGSKRMPDVSASLYDISILGGLEMGVRIGRSGLFISGDYEYGVHGFAEGLDGSAYNRTVAAQAGYRFFF